MTGTKDRACPGECRKVLERSYAKRHHALHREKRNTDSQKKRLLNKKKAVAYKGGVCVDCKGVFHPAVYDFHHVNPLEKDITVGNLLNWNWGAQQEELDKCILLCANCHRIRHHGETYV